MALQDSGDTVGNNPQAHPQHNTLPLAQEELIDVWDCAFCGKTYARVQEAKECEKRYSEMEEAERKRESTPWLPKPGPMTAEALKRASEKQKKRDALLTQEAAKKFSPILAEEANKRGERKLLRGEREALRTEEAACDYSQQLWEEHEQIMEDRKPNKSAENATHRPNVRAGWEQRERERASAAADDTHERIVDEDEEHEVGEYINYFYHNITAKDIDDKRTWYGFEENFDEPDERYMVAVGMKVLFCARFLPGGYKYTLMFVDAFSHRAWVFGMHGISGNHVCAALWKFFLSAQRFPRNILCDLDMGFLRGAALCLLTTYGIRLDTSRMYDKIMRVYGIEEKNNDRKYIWDNPREKKVEWDNLKHQEREALLIAKILLKIANKEELDSDEGQLAMECASDALVDRLKK
jgi:hypothetical protein